MKGDPIPPEHHVTRYCGGSSIDEDGNPNGTAFRRRPSEDAPSVNWVEFLEKASTVEAVDEIRTAFKRKGFGLGATAKFALLNVGQTVNYVVENSDDSRLLKFQHDPVETPGIEDPSHAIVEGILPGEDLVADLIAETIVEMFPARDG